MRSPWADGFPASPKVADQHMDNCGNAFYRHSAMELAWHLVKGGHADTIRASDGERIDGRQAAPFAAEVAPVYPHSRLLLCCALPRKFVFGETNRKRYEKTTAPGGEAYAPGLKRIGIQNWRRASTFAGMSRQSCRASGGVPGLRVAGGSAGRPASSTQWIRIGRSRVCSVLSEEKSRDQTRGRSFMT